MSRIDLHLHTTHSDGSFSTRDVMAFAKQAGVTALAITDHDIVEGIAEATAIGAELGIEVHYSTHTPSQTTEYLELAKQCDLLVTGGSDFHGVTKPDIEVGIGRGQLKVSEKLLDPLRKAATSN